MTLLIQHRSFHVVVDTTLFCLLINQRACPLHFNPISTLTIQELTLTSGLLLSTNVTCRISCTKQGGDRNDKGWKDKKLLELELVFSFPNQKAQKTGSPP